MNTLIVKYQKYNTRFEIITFPGSVRKYFDKIESLQNSDLNNILASDVIYSNAKKGMKAKKEDLEKVFESSDLLVCVKIILNQGRSQTTGNERKHDSDQKLHR